MWIPRPFFEQTPVGPWSFSVALVGGALLGLFYFGGLYWTTRRLPNTPQPGLLVLLSFWLRTVLTVVGFLLVTGGQWLLLLAALSTFLIARTVLVRRWGPRNKSRLSGGSNAAESG